MTEKLQAPRGTRDIAGETVARFQDIEQKARDLFRHYGYTEIRTPIFETRELFERSVGGETDIVSKEMYAFTDRKGRNLALRPEGTAGAVRAYIEGNYAQQGVTKFWYTGPMFRADRPQKGRYRQFYQLGCELLGARSIGADLEMIDIAARLLERLGVGAALKLNHLGCAACKDATIRAIVAWFGEHRAVLCPDCLVRLEKNPLRLLDCKVPACRALAAGVPPVALCGACQGELDAFERGLAAAGLAHTVDRHLVRGLDYYTGIVYEMTSDQLGAQDALLGGGRYDGLVEQLGGPATPAVGFALGMDRLADLVRPVDKPDAQAVPYLYVIGLGPEAQAPAALVTRLLRRLCEEQTLTQSLPPEWIEQELAGRSLKAALRQADRLKAAYALILGENELQNGTLLLRDMTGGGQASVSLLGVDRRQAGMNLAAAMDELARLRKDNVKP